MKKQDGNYEERMLLWRESLLNEKAQHEESIKHNRSSMRLMQQQNKLHENQIKLINDEIKYADKELVK